MRNRAGITKEKEDAFINGGSAALNQKSAEPELASALQNKAKVKARPVSISFTDDILQAIDNIIRNEIIAGDMRVNRSDVVRAAVLALNKLPAKDVTLLIDKSKLQ